MVSYDLFPQHYILPEFIPNKHTTAVYNGLVNSLGKLQPRSQKVLLRKLNTTIKRIASESGRAIQRVGGPTTTESGSHIQRVVGKEVTTTTDPTSAKALGENQEHTQKSHDATPQDNSHSSNLPSQPGKRLHD